MQEDRGRKTEFMKQTRPQNVGTDSIFNDTFTVTHGNLLFKYCHRNFYQIISLDVTTLAISITDTFIFAFVRLKEAERLRSAKVSCILQRFAVSTIEIKIRKRARTAGTTSETNL